MDYIYDIYINLHKRYYDFFDWNKNDKIIHIKKIPIFKIMEQELQCFIKDDIKIDLEFINELKDKTISFNSKKQHFMCMFTDLKNEIVVQTDKKGNIIKKSSIHFTDKYDNIETLKSLNQTKIKYEIKVKKKMDILNRPEFEQRTFVLNNIEKLTTDKLMYLYFDCFNKKITNIKQIKAEIIDEILKNNFKVLETTYKFFELIYEI